MDSARPTGDWYSAGAGRRTTSDRGPTRPRPGRADIRHLYAALIDLFPMLRGTKVTHARGGVLGVTRDWSASVGLEGGLAWAGGYVGDGVSTTNLAGRTLRDLIVGSPTDLTALPWVGHHSPAWEPEPLRWFGVNAGRAGVTLADVEERLTGRPSTVARLLTPLLG